MREAKDYNWQGGLFERMPCTGFLVIPVLEFLKGHKWDAVALAYVHGLRPSFIRVTEGMVHADARMWRVTVTVSKDGRIEGIRQEVEVGLPEGVVHGEALRDALQHGIDSRQVKWWSLSDCVYHSSEGSFQVLPDGTSVPYPVPGSGEQPGSSRSKTENSG